MQQDFSQLIEAMYHRDYQFENQLIQCKRALKKALSELPQEFSSHFSTHNQYHDWRVANVQWDCLHSRIVLTLQSPIHNTQIVEITFSNVTVCEIGSVNESEKTEAFKISNQPDTIYLMLFIKNKIPAYAAHQLSHAYTCIIRLFGSVRIKIVFSDLSFVVPKP